jgi:hypothetical protein
MLSLAVITIAAMNIGCQKSGGAVSEPVPGRVDKSRERARSVQELILDAVLNDLVSNPDLKDDREFYGVPGDKRIALVTNPQYGIPWPETYKPCLDGFTVLHIRRDAKDNDRAKKPRMLGVRINKMDLQQRQGGIWDAPVEITILNAGGTKDGIIMGGCSVYYVPKLEGGRWTVEYAGSQSL